MGRAALIGMGGVVGLLLLGAVPRVEAPTGRPTFRPLAATGLSSIVAGAVITQGFGCTPFTMEPANPACPSGHFHSGIDLAAPYGVPVFAAGDGICQVVASSGGYGLHVLLRHGGSMLTLYGHLSAVVVRDGQSLVAGQELGRLGSTGMSTGPHVHFEVRQAGQPVDPKVWLPVLQGIPASGGGRGPKR